MGQKKKICWITADCFADCDLYSGVMEEVLKRYNVHWIILFEKNNRFKETDFDMIRKNNKNLTMEFFYSNKRMRNPANLWKQMHLSHRIKQQIPDIIYMNHVVTTPWQIPMFLSIPKKCFIMAAHQGEVHLGMDYRWLQTVLRYIVYSRVRYVNLFSKSQAVLFHKHFPNAQIYQMVLALKNFGKPTLIKKDDSIVRFLSFGTINRAKNIELLIDAACLLYEHNYKNFKISINGNCENWEFYQKRIKYPEIFELNIRTIDNGEIPNLFAQSDYLVQPYRVVSQSGPTKIAFTYNIPIIASNLSGFTDEIHENINGYLFKSEDINDLARVMANALDTKDTKYEKLKESMLENTERIYSLKRISANYIQMFDDVIKNASM